MRIKYTRQMLRSAVLLALTACSFEECEEAPVEPITCTFHVTSLYPPDNPQVPGARPITLHVGGISDPESAIYEGPGLSCNEHSRTEGVHWSIEDTTVARIVGSDHGDQVRVEGVAYGFTPLVLTGVESHNRYERYVSVTKAGVASVLVTPASATLQSGQTITLTATITDASGVAVTDVPITWSSADSRVASLPANATGATVVVTAGTPGGPIAITATAGDVSGSSQITVQAPPAGVRLAYALADLPHATSTYTPSPSRRFSSTNGGIRVTRTGLGTYSVAFDGQQRAGAGTETVLVTAVGVETDAEFNMCRTTGWTNTPTGLTADVNCTDSDGDPDDQGFAILLMGDNALKGRLGFAIADQPTASSYTPDPATQFSSSGQPLRVTHRGNGPGAYSVQFPGLDRPTVNDREAVIVSAYGSGTGRCGADILVGSSVDIQCVQFNGQGADTRFAVALVGVDPTFVSGIARIDNAGAVASGSAFNRSGGNISVAYPSTGRSDVTFAGLASTLGSGSNPTHVQLTGTDGSGECKLTTSGWQIIGQDVVVHVQCYDRFEVPAHIAYTVLVIH